MAMPFPGTSLPVGKNQQGKGKAHPSPMSKTHAGMGNHKKVFTSTGAARNNGAAPTPNMVHHNGQPC